MYICSGNFTVAYWYSPPLEANRLMVNSQLLEKVPKPWPQMKYYLHPIWDAPFLLGTALEKVSGIGKKNRAIQIAEAENNTFSAYDPH